jgi:hypothetical protein
MASYLCAYQISQPSGKTGGGVYLSMPVGAYHSQRRVPRSRSYEIAEQLDGVGVGQMQVIYQQQDPGWA